MIGMSKQQLHGKRLCDVLPSYRSNGIFDDLVKVAHGGGVHEAEWQSDHPAHRPSAGCTARWWRSKAAWWRSCATSPSASWPKQRIRHMAHHDDLTGLPNRSLIRDRLDQAIRHAAPQRPLRGAWPSSTSTASSWSTTALATMPATSCSRWSARAWPAACGATTRWARFGGDEFVIILADQPDDPMALAPVLEKIRQAVNEPVLLEGQEVQVSCSMGVVMYPRDGDDPNTLMMNADAAMYRAKELGKNNFQFYAREMNASVEEKLVLLEGLRNALDDAASSSLLYQPKVDLRTRPHLRRRGADPLAASGARHDLAAALHRRWPRKAA